MLKTRRRLPQFDCLEDKVLLSAAAGHRDVAKRFLLNGSLSGLPNGSPGINGFTETSFPVAGHLASMGKINGSFSLEDGFIPVGKQLNLNGASLTLDNSKGSVHLAIAQAKKHQYKFTVVSGTKGYAKAAGSGTIAISSPQGALDLVIKLHSTVVKKS
jgi:hypothetical protein